MDCPAGDEARATTLALPQHPDAPLYQPESQDGHLPFIARSSWSCPLTWDPSTSTLESYNHLQSGAFWKPGDPPWDLEVCTGLGSQASTPPWHSPPTNKGHLGALSGGKVTIAPFCYLKHVRLLPSVLPVRGSVWMSQPEGVHWGLAGGSSPLLCFQGQLGESRAPPLPLALPLKANQFLLESLASWHQSGSIPAPALGQVTLVSNQSP